MLIVILATALPAAADDIARAAALIEAAEQKPDLQALTEAEKILTSACQGPRRNPSCEYWLARDYLAQHNYYTQVKSDKKRAEETLDLAENMARQASARRPNDARVHVLLGKIFQLRLAQSPVSGITRALISGSPVTKEYERALEIEPTNGEAMLGLGIYYQFVPIALGGDPHRARKYFKDAAKQMPTNPEPLVWLSISYREEGRLDDARLFLDRALGLDPDNPFALAEDQRMRAAEQAARPAP